MGLPVLRVALFAVVLLGALSGVLALVGQPSASGSASLSLPNPVSIAAVRYNEPPLKVLLVGDSMAGSLGVGLGELAPGYNVELVNAAHPGCSVSEDGMIELTYFDAAPGAPCALDRPDRILAVWQSYVDAFRPDVVVYLARSDLLNQQIEGHWTWVGHRIFNLWFDARLRAMLSVFMSHGASVVLMTVPVSEEPTLNERPQDNPIRIAREGKILRIAAASDPSRVLVYDLSALLTPDFRYRVSSNGLPLHCADGVHLTSEAGVVVAADLYPRLWALAATRRVPGGGHWLGRSALPPTTPTWFTKLDCS
jgi:hypothetical protein